MNIYNLEKDIIFNNKIKCNSKNTYYSIEDDPYIEIYINTQKELILEIDANIEDGEFIEIYWANSENDIYTKEKRIRKKIKPGIYNKYTFQIPELNVYKIRIDPTNKKNTLINIESIRSYFKEDNPLKINVGCGPFDHKDSWINVDIQDFPSVDKVMDVTKSWEFSNVKYIFAEHFIEHLKLEQIINFLYNAGKSLADNGVVRISTPNLKYVVESSLFTDILDSKEIIEKTLKLNRAFYGWGHSFLYTEEFLIKLLEEIGYVNIKSYKYGESNISDLKYIEQHRHNTDKDVIVIEAQKGNIKFPNEFNEFCNLNFIKYNNAKG